MTTSVAGVGGVTTTPATATTATTSTDTSQSSSMLNPQAFLQLLVAQLQYQDPTSPVDTSTFMNQTAMLSQVQTMNGMSTTLNSLVASQQGQAATSMIGKSVTFVDATGATGSGIVTGASLGTTGASVEVGNQYIPITNIREVKAAP